MSELILSVCVLTYNQEKYISQTLDSIINQKHDYTYEIVVSDDCSLDGTRKIISEYAKKYPAIIKPIYNEHNLGLIGNYFNNINNCKGKYVMECAGDDCWLPGKVAFQIDYMEKNPDIGMCYGKAKVWNQRREKYDNASFGSKKETFNKLIQGNDIPAPTVCFRQSVFVEYQKEIKPQYKNWLMEDYPAWLWISKKSKIHFINKDFAIYRKLEDSVSHGINYIKRDSFIRSTNDIKSFYLSYFNYKTKDSSSELQLFLARNAFYYGEYQIGENYLNSISSKNNLSLKDRIIYFIFKYRFMRKIYLILF